MSKNTVTVMAGSMNLHVVTTSAITAGPSLTGVTTVSGASAVDAHRGSVPGAQWMGVSGEAAAAPLKRGRRITPSPVAANRHHHDGHNETHKNIAGEEVNDYIPHHEPFEYYASTANPQHLPPTSVSMIGRQDQANHQYDVRDFWASAEAGDMSAVSYVKAPAYVDGHAGYSDPLDEQRYLADFINRLEKLPTWSSTAVIINWDDSDGWYDHQIGPIVRQSQTALDALTGTGECGSNALRVPLSEEGTPEQGRCGVGPRIPLLVVSPYARSNYVDDSFTTQTSVVKFIEDNWLGGQRIGGGSADATTGTLNHMFNFHQAPLRRLFLNPETGQPASGH